MIVVRALIVFAILAAILPTARASWAADAGSAPASPSAPPAVHVVASPSAAAPPAVRVVASPSAAAAPATAKARAAEIVTLLKEYRATLERLLPLEESDLARAVQRRDERRELLARGIISRKEFEETEEAVERAKQKLGETQHAIIDVDHALAEATTARALAGLPPLGPGSFERSAGLVRFNGTAAWSLKEGTVELQEFYLRRFGRPLPISAYGQTPLHDRMGLDHRDALDIAVYPDSPEGRALMNHLRATGIPFIAAWTAVPGAASGAHIHVGQPSPRIAVRR